MRLSDRLRAEADGVWSRILEHPFPAALCRGELAPEKFSRYLLQDYGYLLGSLRNFCRLASRAEREELLLELAALIGQETAGELAAYRGFLQRLGFSLTEARDVEPFAARRGYLAFLWRAADERPLPEGLAAALPCYWSYLEIAERYRPELERGGDHPGREWMRVYLDGDYRDLVERLRGQVDLAGAGYPFAPLAEVFLEASCWELRYWDEAWSGNPAEEG